MTGATHFTFQPLLYQVALAVLSPANIASPIRAIVRGKQNIEVLMDEAIAFDLIARRVQLRSGAEMDYDYLMVATGATHSYFGDASTSGPSWLQALRRLKMPLKFEDAFCLPSSWRRGRCWRPGHTPL